MKKLRILCLLLMLTVFCAAPARKALSVIPQPAESVLLEGQPFRFPKKFVIHVPKAPGDSLLAPCRAFAQSLTKATGLNVQVKTAKRATWKADHSLRLLPDATIGPEAYTLRITAEGIRLAAGNAAGFFYGLQTLKQLLPPNVAAGTPDAARAVWTVPACDVNDRPRFGWRGFMLDEGRHFFGKTEVKRVLDIMALYKMNRFHWHLTEDQGWRIEIKKYPKLTEVGAWRRSKTLPWDDVPADTLFYGGFYTQDDIREIVQYAKERFIEVVPEIDMPGHFQAAVAAYPELFACVPGRHEVLIGQGVSADVMNVASPGALQFTKDLYDELVTLFPFGYFHFGGDECPTTLWEQNAECTALLRQIGSTRYRDLQTHFYKQILDYIATKPAAEQRKLIFWNEVLHGNTSALKGITVLAWVGANKAARDAAARGFDAILSPQPQYYINRKQSESPDEPHTQGGGKETLKAVYDFVPAEGVTPALLSRYIGVQANFWTEWVDTPELLEYLLLPRLGAVAEAGWTPQSLRRYDDFRRRAYRHTEIYRLAGYKYGTEAFK